MVYHCGMPQNHDQIRTDIANYLAQPVHHWFDTAKILMRVEQTGYWSSNASSFSAWLSLFAAQIKLGETSLWRYKTAYEILITTHEKLLKHGHINLPSVESHAKTSNPENLEIYDRLSRVIPTFEALDLGWRVLSGLTSRDELRTLWKIYRPLLGGKTSRGLGVEPPRIEDHTKLIASQIQADVLNAIKVEPDWIAPKGSLVKTFVNVDVPAAKTGSKPVNLDAVVVVQRCDAAEPDIHVIKVVDTNEDAKKLEKVVRTQTQYGHFFWLAVNSQTASSTHSASLPLEHGEIWCLDRTVKVVLNASRTNHKHVGSTALALLKATLHR